jgi:hypothetical protein
MPLLKQKFSPQARLLTVQQQAFACEMCKVRVRVHVCLLIQATCISETLRKNERPSNPAQAETTGTENQDLLKTQTLTLTEKRKTLQGKLHRTNQSEVKPKL